MAQGVDLKGSASGSLVMVCLRFRCELPWPLARRCDATEWRGALGTGQCVASELQDFRWQVHPSKHYSLEFPVFSACSVVKNLFGQGSGRPCFDGSFDCFAALLAQ